MKKNKNILPSTETDYATIRLTDRQKKRVFGNSQIFFRRASGYPSNLRIFVPDQKYLSEDAKKRLKGDILEIK